MVPLLVAIAIIVGVLVLLARMRPGSAEDGGGAEAEGTSTGLQPLLGVPLNLAPDDWVQVGSFGHNEAQIVRGLLDSCGIRAAFEATGPHAPPEVRMPTGATRFRVYVSPEDADAARELLQS